MSSVDWNAAKKIAKAGADIPEAEYNLILTDAKAYVASTDQSPGIRFTFKVEDGEYKGAIVKHAPTLKLDRPEFVVRLLTDLSVLGVPDQMLTGNREMEEIVAIIMQQPRRCRAATAVNDFNGSKSNQIKPFSTLMPAVGASPGGGGFSIAPASAVQTASAPFIAPPNVVAPKDVPPPPF